MDHRLVCKEKGELHCSTTPDMGLDRCPICEAFMVPQMEYEFGRAPRTGYHLTRNLLSKKVIEIEDDTPLCCDPSSETYWSM